MFDWFGFGKAAVSEVKDRVQKRTQHNRELRWDFILEAIGAEPLSCLEWPSQPDGGVSFDTVTRRLADLQARDPERA